jgi:diguanylate cyclase with GGDEF domain
MTDIPADARPVYDTPIFLTLLSREAGRASRYRDFFGLCLLTPDRRGAAAAAEPIGLHATIADLLRATDLVGRVDDAVAFLLVNTSPTDSLAIAERVRARLAESDPVSIGLASFPKDGTDAQALLDRARALLEQARHAGGNRVRDADSVG